MMVVASLRMVVVTFRVDTGWAIFFILAGFVEIGLAAVGLPIIGALVNLFSFLLSIKFLIEFWSEFRGPINLAFAGFLLIIAGPIATVLGMAGAGGIAQQGGGQVPVVNEGKQLTGLRGAAAATDSEVPANRPNAAVPKGAELPALPVTNLPQPSNVSRQPSGRVVTFRVQKFTGQGDPIAAAREALGNVPWADLEDIKFDRDSSELCIGQLGG